ncbi:hypothetical protein LP414_17970 [Polaromonas sp. P1(28)-13]|nr:hypothetical protein LP414_17970 [Polaromonas sp. P1(28)-13]
MLRTLTLIGALFTTTIAIAQNTKPFTIGVITDISGPYSAITGKGSVEACKNGGGRLWWQGDGAYR